MMRGEQSSPAPHAVVLHVQEGAVLVGREDVDLAVACDVARDEVAAGAACHVNHVLDERRAARAPLQLEPDDQRGIGGAGIGHARRVRVPALAGHDVRQAVAVDVGHRHRVHLAQVAGRRRRRQDLVSDEGR
jgi:hypothetical protein